MPDADLTLDGGNAIVDGNWLEVRCWDIKLDASDRRSSSAGERRALVHGFDDELVVNYADDYPGGVTLRGEVHLPGKIKENHVRLEAHDLHLDHPARRTPRGSTSAHRRALVHGFNDELVLNWAKDYPGGVVAHGNLEVQQGGRLRVRSSSGDVVAELNTSGNLSLGGGGVDGDVICKDGAGVTLMHIDPQHKRMDFNDSAGAAKVRIDTDEFLSAPWPEWAGEAVVSRLDLISELRRMKEEIVALRAEVEALKAVP